MNILLFFLIMLFLGGNNSGNLLDLLLRLDYKSFAPVLKLLGVNQKIIDILSSDELSSALNGNIDLQTILKAVSLLSSHTESKDEEKENGLKETNESVDPESDFLDPIKSVAPSEIEESLGNFFG